MKKKGLTKTEESVMLFLWDQDKPLSIQEMVEVWDGKEKPWKDNYLRAIIHSLEVKGVVEYSNSLDRRGNRYARRFQPTISKKDYYAKMVKGNGLSVREMVEAEAVAMIQNEDREGLDALIRDLEEIIEEYRQRDDDAE